MAIIYTFDNYYNVREWVDDEWAHRNLVSCVSHIKLLYASF